MKVLLENPLMTLTSTEESPVNASKAPSQTAKVFLRVLFRLPLPDQSKIVFQLLFDKHFITPER
jgi:hypothetical protein